METKTSKLEKKVLLYPTSKSKEPFEYRLNEQNDTLYSLKTNYDKKNKLKIKENSRYKNNQKSSTLLIYYNQKGQELKRQIVEKELTYTSLEIAYNKNGDPIQETYYNKDGSVEKLLKMTYQYDKKNNWISKIVTKNEVLSEILNRKIVYYK